MGLNFFRLIFASILTLMVVSTLAMALQSHPWGEIDTSGNIGIGVLVPDSKLSISGDISLWGGQFKLKDTTGQINYASIKHDGTNVLISNEKSNGGLKFKVGTTEVLDVDSAGNIGLSTLKLTPKSSAPFTCSSANTGVIYFSSASNNFLKCDGTSWVDYRGPKGDGVSVGTISASSVSASTCASGTAYQIPFYRDTNNNGAVDAGETLINTAYACKGATGNTGATGPMPSHSWSGTQVRFQNSDSSWGSYTDLKGATGADGKGIASRVLGATGVTTTTCGSGAAYPIEFYRDANNNGAVDAGESLINTAYACKGDVGATGATGVAGTNGAPGANGKTVLNGASAPSSNTGVVGDFYIDTTSKTIYGPKTASSWGGATALVGPGGANGAPGAQGPGVVVGTAVAEGPGSNCGNGGYKVTWYADTNLNGVKDSGETTVTGTTYQCKGNIGATGAPGPAGDITGQSPNWLKASSLETTGDLLLSNHKLTSTSGWLYVYNRANQWSGLVANGLWISGTYSDANDPTYYVDPNSNSRLNGLVVGGTLEVTGDSIKGKRFYDYDDNNYYVDPASNSRLNNVYVSGILTFGWERKPNSCYSSSDCSATCSPGKKVIGGGCKPVTQWYAGAVATLIENYPDSDASWRCLSDNQDGESGVDMHAYAICANVA